MGTDKPGMQLNILHLEDNAMDAELICEYLRANAGYDIAIYATQHRENFLEALEQQRFDLILSDFNLPGMNGFDALSLAKQYAPFTPFICISGNIGEETAVELMKQGATDYVLKDSMGRLVYSIERAIKAAREEKNLRATQKNLLENEARVKAMIANISDVIAIIDQNGIFTYVSSNIEKWFGWQSEQMFGKDIFARIHPDDLYKFIGNYRKLINGEVMEKSLELGFECADSSYKFIQMSANNLFSNPNISGILINFHDITDRKKWENEIKFLSCNDFLTGLYNRFYFEAELKRLDTERQLPIAVIMGDINGLKLINDALGHHIGDKVLIETAKIMKKCCREEDIVCRIGGDEFFVLLTQTDRQSAKLICERISTACRDFSIAVGDSFIYPSISLGYAVKNNKDDKLDQTVRNAEKMMYKRKLLESKSAHSAIVASFKATMFEKSQETEEHAERMTFLSKGIGCAMHLSEEQMSELELLAALHDIGKISVDHEILCKPGKLSTEDWDEIKKHPGVGYRIARSTPELVHVAECILCHHERWDGQGYPQGLSGRNIPLLSRIIALVDSYDAMTSDRPYKLGVEKEQAIEEIKKCSGTQFDPEIAKVFVEKVLGHY